jgi:hypothetical protein
MALIPASPSFPIPVRITPIAKCPKIAAASVIITSTEGVCRVLMGSFERWTVNREFERRRGIICQPLGAM